MLKCLKMPYYVIGLTRQFDYKSPENLNSAASAQFVYLSTSLTLKFVNIFLSHKSVKCLGRGTSIFLRFTNLLLSVKNVLVFFTVRKNVLCL